LEVSLTRPIALFVSLLISSWAVSSALPAEESAAIDLDGRRIKIASNATLGDSAAPVTLVEFLDFECGFCVKHLAEMLPKLMADYIDTGKARYVEMDFPLSKIHPRAVPAARAGHCAAEQGGYWELRDRMLAPGADLENWDEHVAALGLDANAFEACVSGPDSARAVRSDQLQGTRLRVPGTPTLVVALTDPTDPSGVDGVSLLAGSKSWEAIQSEIERALGMVDGAAAMGTDPIASGESTDEVMSPDDGETVER